ncbi:hypothetical protein [Paenibacillus prosopidis]|uniref:Uncharacterized protein n=1 Tax=Paenibacillus prosopidis TaxID=630520 RepID=A0A368VGV7_9BACL|nr:hypothetical protein [Paenibacillus prosopidis]RCW40343.1 hypothetical protein DFP97_1355 [Paenibacillus prosopidis]
MIKKSVQVIDGGVNGTNPVFEVSEQQFVRIFPDGQDIAFLSDFPELEDDIEFWNNFYHKKIDKKNVNGIHGTLHTRGSFVEPEYFPSRRESDVKTK